jgi:acyl-CoA synthetase (AMP-forming)/AMP-acid ligase II
MDIPASVTAPEAFDHIGRAIWLHGISTPHRPCAVLESVSMTYGELTSQSSAVAASLMESGLAPGERVGILMGNELTFLPLIVGIWMAGGVVVPFSNLLPAEAFGKLIVDADLRAVVCSSQLRNQMQGGLESIADERKPRLFRDVDLVQSRAHGHTLRAPQLIPSDPCSLLYSSGTTGIPKGILHSHHARLMFALGMAAELSISRWSRVLLTTPMYSNGAWLMILPTLLMGGTLHVMPAFSIEGFISTCSRASITHTFAVPLQCAVVLTSPNFSKDHLSALEALVCGGAALNQQVKRKWLEVLGEAFVELYGMTEGFGTLVKPAVEAKPFECGVGSPMAGTDLRVINDSGAELAVGEVGEIVGRSSVLLTEYFRKPDQDAEAIWYDQAGTRFFRSGDIGYLDLDRNLHIVDRKKDMIISGGFNVYPSDIEAVLMAHPEVREASVIGVADDKWGETPLALVIRKPDATIDAESLRSWCNERLSKIQRVSQLEFVAEFPRNALGKVLKRELRRSRQTALGGKSRS